MSTTEFPSRLSRSRCFIHTKNCSLILFGIPTFFCILSTCRACRMLSVCAVFIYIYIYILSPYIYLYTSVYIHIIYDFF